MQGATLVCFRLGLHFRPHRKPALDLGKDQSDAGRMLKMTKA